MLPMPGSGEVRHQEATALLSSLDPASAAMVFADPPYGIGYHSNHYVGKNPHSPVEGDWNVNIGRFLRRPSGRCGRGGALYLCSRWDVLPAWVPQISPPLRLSTVIAWVKNNHSAGDLTGSYGNKWEAILFIPKGRHLLRGKRYPNVWEFKRVPSTEMLHPTQKPLGLVERAVLASSDPGDLVVDPFSGSGTTALAAAMNGRRYLVGDIDPEMVRLTRRRLGEPDGDPPSGVVDSISVPIDYLAQIEHQFGAPADDLAEIAAALRGRNAVP